jgi:hypothetical protein
MRLNVPVIRNVVIILAVAAVIDIVPGGGTSANVVVQAVSLAFLGALIWVASIMYREHRSALYLLGDRRRAALYAAIMAVTVTLTATSRLWASSSGSVAWLVLIGASVYVGCAVIWSARRY